MSGEIWLWAAVGILAAAAALLVLRPLARAGMGALPAAALAAAPAVLAFALYLWIGQPGLPDMPFGDRDAETRQHAELLRLATDLEARLETAPDDARGWRVLAAAWRGLGRTEETADALARAVQAEGGPDNAPAGLLADYGEARATASAGIVTPEALAAFRAALERGRASEGLALSGARTPASRRRSGRTRPVARPGGRLRAGRALARRGAEPHRRAREATRPRRRRRRARSLPERPHLTDSLFASAWRYRRSISDNPSLAASRRIS